MIRVAEEIDRIGNLYDRLFGDWLHVHFIIRTAILLFAVWIVVFIVCTKLNRVIFPILIYIGMHVFFRAWNFIFVETFQELFLINQHKKGQRDYSYHYLKYSDKVNRNRAILQSLTLKSAFEKSRKFGMRLLFSSLIIGTLSVMFFSLYFEFVYSGESYYVYYVYNQSNVNIEAPIPTPEPTPEEYIPYNDNENVFFIDWELGDQMFFSLNEAGRIGARLHDGPGITGHTVVEILWDDAELLFLDYYVQDQYVPGLFWFRVLSPSDRVGYISSQLVEPIQ